MSVLGMLAWCAAAVSLWLGARRYDSAVARAYRWLAGGAALYCAGLVIQGILGGTLNPAPDLFVHRPAAAAGPGRRGGRHRDAHHGRTRRRQQPPGRRRAGNPARPDGPEGAEGSAGSVLPGLADGYVMAVALLVIGWITLFSGEFHRSGERPGTFLLALIHPLADLAVLGALLPMVTTAWRRVDAALPVPARHRRRRRAGRGPAGVGRTPGRRGAVDAGGRGAAARRGPVAGDRTGELDPPDHKLGGGDRHRRAGRVRGHPGGDRERPGRGAGRPGSRWSWRAAPGCWCWPRGSSCWSGRTWLSSAYGGSPAGACAIWPTGPAT